ncbi:MAG: basic amino acid ABC transporter substrate-binding protein [Prochloraceae cyanobacterium]
MTRGQFLRHFTCGLGTTLVLAACRRGSDFPLKPKTSKGKETTNTNILRVATAPASPPFSFQGQDGKIQGFDIDLINAIGQKAGLEIQFQFVRFERIIPLVAAGKVDAAISAITITTKRLQTIDFSQPYFKSGLAIAIRKDNTQITKAKSLEGKIIGVRIGTTAADRAAQIPNAQLSFFDFGSFQLQELYNGTVDAVIRDAPILQYLLTQGGFKQIKILEELLSEDYYGIALPKNSPKLPAVNDALKALINKGSYAQIYQKWFKDKPPTLPT